MRKLLGEMFGVSEGPEASGMAFTADEIKLIVLALNNNIGELSEDDPTARAMEALVNKIQGGDSTAEEF